MKKESINKVKLGIFISLGIVVFITGIYFIGETKQLFSSTIRISALFTDINGLQVGNNVRFAGINIGSVVGIQIVSDSAVKVDMIIDVKTQKFIKKDATAIIATDGLMGNKIMVISSGTSNNKQVEDNDMIGTTLPMNFDDMLVKLKTTGDNAALITNDLAAILSSIRSGEGTVGKLFSDKDFANNLDGILVNLNQGTIGFRTTFDKQFNNNLDSILINVKNGTKGFKSTFDSNFASNINEILVNIKGGTNGFNKTMDAAKDSWLLGSFWGGKSDDEEDKEKIIKEKSKNTDLLIKDVDENNQLLKYDSTSVTQDSIQIRKKIREEERLRLIKIIRLYDEEILKEKKLLQDKPKK